MKMTDEAMMEMEMEMEMDECDNIVITFAIMNEYKAGYHSIHQWIQKN